ncbi:MAG: transporter [Cytophagales bacterium]|nr:transporter [Cytophagales bacterium]
MKISLPTGKAVWLVLSFLLVGRLAAQTPTDGLMMSRGNFCAALVYNHSQWNQYWEGTNFRANPNLGTVSMQSGMAMGALGITDNLNLIVALPYVQTRASASYLQGQRGFQDASVWLKYRFAKTQVVGGTLSAFVTGGVSTPTTNYLADYLPLSIGLRSQTASSRLVLDYLSKPGFYVTAQAGYTRRGNIRIDRDSYLYENRLYYTNEVRVPDMADGTVRIGFRNKRFQTDVYLERFAALSGDDIRYNDMPFPTNAMKATTVGWYGRLNIKQLSIIGGASHVLSGRNVGQSTGFSAGVLYAFRVFGHGEKCAKPEEPQD